MQGLFKNQPTKQTKNTKKKMLCQKKQFFTSSQLCSIYKYLSLPGSFLVLLANADLNQHYLIKEPEKHH